MIADDIIETVARHTKPQSNTSEVNHEFECEVRGQKFDVEICLRVSTKKKH